MAEPYELFAIRYAHVERRSSENFLDGELHDSPMPLDYFVWVARNKERTLLIDTGFDEKAALVRKRTLIRPVKDGLAALGIDHTSVEDVIITHMHYDHAGNGDLFPNARFHIQTSEMAFATGPCMCAEHRRLPYAVADIQTMVGRLFAGRVRFCEGESHPFEGVGLHHIGGHSRGMQAVSILTERGKVILASDTMHHYRHFNERRVFPVVDDPAAVVAGYDRLRALAPSVDHLVPGHDPLVMTRYPAESSATDGWIVRLDQPCS